MLQPESPVASDTREPQRGRGAVFLCFIGVLLVLVLSWTYLLWMDWGMRHMSEAADMLLMPRMVDWSATDLVLVFLMWALMMAAMMLPSAFPSIRLYARVRGNPAGFVTGYLLAWFGFAALATLAQWRLLEAALVTPMMTSVSTPLSAGLLIAAGLFQLTPLKDACLTRCRSPLGLLLAGYANRSGALGEGFRNGMYCVGCCFALMGILFVVGVMNLLCVFLIAAYIAIEKVAPRTALLSRGMGALLCLWGVFLIVAGWGK
jgi:predicted metal-binding membrane protein